MLGHPALSSLDFRGTLDTERRVGDCVETSFWNNTAAFNTRTVLSFFNPFKSRFDQLECVFLGLQQTERELLFLVVTSQIRHVNWHAGQVAAGLGPRLIQRSIGHGIHITAQTSPQKKETFLVCFHIRFFHMHRSVRTTRCYVAVSWMPNGHRPIILKAGSTAVKWPPATNAG